MANILPGRRQHPPSHGTLSSAGIRKIPLGIASFGRMPADASGLLRRTI
jgi:hypothetical protein